MAKALISIDYTEDFVADHGKLTAVLQLKQYLMIYMG